MKKIFISICMILAMCATSVTAFAAEPVESAAIETVATETELVATPRQQGLWYVPDTWFAGIYNSSKVTPTKGSELRLWLKTNNSCRVIVYETNLIGTYSQVYSANLGAGERDISVVGSCNGKEYLVQFRSDGGVTFSALVYQR